MAPKLALTNEELPEEIMEQIQTRLPVKSLLHFACVSKGWSSRMADPKFAKTHYILASEKQTLSRRLLLWKNCEFESLDIDNSSFRKVTFPFKRPEGLRKKEPAGLHVDLLGSCNGLIFLFATVNAALSDVVDFYIWNPSTGFIRKLPAPSFPYGNDICKCGFGYVSATDDYKVVISTFVEGQRFFEIFSWRANSWKMIQAPLFEEDEIVSIDDGISSKGTVLNEALHWIEMFVEPRRDKAKAVVLVFDLVKEEFQKLPLPNIVNYKECSWTLGVCGGCLSVASIQKNIVQLWIMREYKVPESWEKLSEFRLGVNAPFISNSMELLIYWESFVLMLRSGEKLIRFDFKEGGKTEKKDMVCSRDKSEYKMTNSDVIGYVESLLRPYDYDT